MKSNTSHSLAESIRLGKPQPVIRNEPAVGFPRPRSPRRFPFTYGLWVLPWAVSFLAALDPVGAQTYIPGGPHSFTLSIFAEGAGSAPCSVAFSSCCEPRTVLVSDFLTGDIYLLQPGATTRVPSTGPTSACGLAQVRQPGGALKYYLCQGGPERVVEIDSAGQYVRTVADDASLLGFAMAIAPYPPILTNLPGFTGHLFVGPAGPNTNTILNLDPSVTNTPLGNPQVFLTVPGLAAFAFGPDPYPHGSLYVAVNAAGGGVRISRFSLPDGTNVWVSPPITNATGALPAVPGPAKGIALGIGTLRGYVYINCDDGTVWEMSTPDQSTEAAWSARAIVTAGGSGGHLMAADPGGTVGDVGYSTLLFTTPDKVMRLTLQNTKNPPLGFDGGWFGPPAEDTTPVPTLTGNGKHTFTLSMFACGFATIETGSGPIGPLNVAFVTPQALGFPSPMLVTEYSSGRVYLFPDDDLTVPQSTAGVPSSPGAGPRNACALAQILRPDVPGGFFYYMCRQGTGDVVQISEITGEVLRVVASNQTYFASATAMVPYPPTGTNQGLVGHLFVGAGPGIIDLDPTLPDAFRIITNASVPFRDGFVFDTNGLLYAVQNSSTNGSKILGFTVPEGRQFWEFGPYTNPITHLPPGFDGLAAGLGSLAGYLYANCNDGSVVEICTPYGPEPAGTSYVICTGGSRGDFVSADNGPYGTSGGFPSLLFTQSDKIMRLDPPPGGFCAGPSQRTDSFRALGQSTLTISLLSASQVQVSWPASYTMWALESTLSLRNPAWSAIPGATNSPVTIQVTSTNRFFRLKGP
jgi:hypothetical protein